MQMRIAKVVRTGRVGEAGSDPIALVHSHFNFGESSRVFPSEMAFEMLEPYALKGARTVLRGLGDGDIPRLPDVPSNETLEQITKTALRLTGF
jgi:hypothetical protein